MTHGHSDQEFWDARYRSHPDAIWSGLPNDQLVAETGGLTPGTALDVGCGEGADAIWLAGHGWQVTAVDVSTVALERAVEAARRAGAEILGRIEWVHADISEWEPGTARFDLVTTQFMHLPSAMRGPLFRRLAAAVAPGGTLLVVGHHPTDLETTVPRPPDPDLFFTGDDVVGALDPPLWEVVTDAAPAREVTDGAGHPVTIHDTVLCARRHAP